MKQTYPPPQPNAGTLRARERSQGLPQMPQESRPAHTGRSRSAVQVLLLALHHDSPPDVIGLVPKTCILESVVDMRRFVLLGLRGKDPIALLFVPVVPLEPSGQYRTRDGVDDKAGFLGYDIKEALFDGPEPLTDIIRRGGDTVQSPLFQHVIGRLLTVLGLRRASWISYDEDPVTMIPFSNGGKQEVLAELVQAHILGSEFLEDEQARSVVFLRENAGWGTTEVDTNKYR